MPGVYSEYPRSPEWPKLKLIWSVLRTSDNFMISFNFNASLVRNSIALLVVDTFVIGPIVFRIRI